MHVRGATVFFPESSVRALGGISGSDKLEVLLQSGLVAGVAATMFHISVQQFQHTWPAKSQLVVRGSLGPGAASQGLDRPPVHPKEEGVAVAGVSVGNFFIDKK